MRQNRLKDGSQDYHLPEEWLLWDTLLTSSNPCVFFVKRDREEVGALKVYIEGAESKGVAEITENNKHTLITANKRQVNLLNVIMRIHSFWLSH